jgi:SAM-dependent methyltransferase
MLTDRTHQQHSDSRILGAGRCSVCGHTGEYARWEAPMREHHACRGCGATLRYRLQASAITATYGRPDTTLAELAAEPAFREFAIYEPGIVGPLRAFLQELPGYVNSYYWPNVAPGQDRDGVRCEDLRDLTFADNSFDLVISSDIFEHVRRPMPAFAEIFRVLRPGCYHIFTVPLRWPFPATTESRVDYSGSEDVFLVPPVYHGSPTDPKGSLVYTDFGMDLPEKLRGLGFETVTHHGHTYAVTFASRKPTMQEDPPTGTRAPHQ